MLTLNMPRLSDSMEEGTILQWLVADGAEISVGEDLLEVETDKATVVYPAPEGGILRRLVEAGETVAVGTPIVEILAAGEERKASSPALPAAAAIGVPGDAAGVDAAAAPVPAERSNNGRLSASPLARRIARDLCVDLDGLAGTGPGGRIVRADVEAAHRTERTEPPGPSPAGEDGVVIELSRVQQRIARRMAEAKSTIPDFQVSMEVDIGEMQGFRRRLKEHGVGASVNDFVVRACALALVRRPRANSSFRDGAIFLHDHVNIGIAVAAPESLLVPVIADADRLSVSAIGAEARRLAGLVRDGSITPPDLARGTFTISNLGMFGVSSFTAVVNPGQAAILAVGASRKHLQRAEGEILEREILELTLSCDHRILYGADAAGFLAEVRDLLEAPLTLLA